MNTTYYAARAPAFSPEYIAYRDRVVADKGSISSATTCQQALDFLAAHPDYQFEQWLDSRFGVRADNAAVNWYSILGAGSTVSRTASAAPLLGADSVLNTPVWARGAFKGGPTPAIPASDSYTIGMRHYIASPGAGGWLFGDRFNDPNPPGTTPYGSWWFFGDTYFQYRFYDAFEGSYQLALDVWDWFWLVLDGQAGTLTLYDGNNTVLFQHARPDTWGRNNFGIGGGTDSSGITDTHLRYQQVVRCHAALTAAQRAAFQAI